MAKMSEDALRALTDTEMRQAVGYWSGTLAIARQTAMAYYLGLPKFDLSPSEIDGRSKVVSPDVRNTIEAMLPQLMVKFAGFDTVVEFIARKPQDERGAEQATDYVNYVYNTVNDGERISYVWMKDALLSKNGIVKVWWDDRWEEKSEEYIGMTDVELAKLADDEEIELTESKTYPDEDDAKKRAEFIDGLTKQLEQAQVQAQQNPQAAQAAAQIQQRIAQIEQTPPKLLYDVTAVRRSGGKRVRVENVPPEEFLISRKAKSIPDAVFVGHRVLRTMSDLRSMGYKNLEGITGDDSAAALNMERIERLGYDDEMAYLNVDTPATEDESQKLVWVTECYVRVDFDGDGISELRKVVRAGNRILENEVVDCAPFVSITPVPMPHKFFGLSIADLAMEGQRINTALLRGMLDNMYLDVNGRYYAVEGQVNLDDLLTSRPGGVVRVKAQGAAGRLDQGKGDTSGAFQLYEVMKQFQEDSTGWSRASQGNSSDALMHPMTATQSNIVTNKADMRVDLVARNFAVGFRELFRMILKLCSQYEQKKRAVKLRGIWVEVNPRDWATGYDTQINVGLGTGNRDQQVQHLMALLVQQQFGLQVGTATPANVYASQAELAKALGYRSAEKFFSDPRTSGFKQPPNPDMLKIQSGERIEQMRLRQDAQKFQADMQLKMSAQQQAHDARMAEIQKQYELQASNDARDSQREAMKAQYEQQRAAAEAENARVLQAMKGEVERYKSDLQAQTQLALAQMSAPPAIDIGPIQASLDSLIAHMAAPIELVRDPKTGRALGVKRGEVVKTLQRDAAGRAQSLQ